MITDIAGIVFVCVTANHLGLVSAVESVIGHKLWIVNCPKCLSFWVTLAYMVISHHNIIAVLAISFLAAYVAVWAELIEGYIDTLYLRLYDKIYPKADNDTLTAADFEDNPDCAVS